MYQIVILLKLWVHLQQVILRRFGVLKCKVYFGTYHVSFFFLKIFYSILCSSYDIYIRKCFRSNGEVEALCVSIWVNCREDISIMHFFLAVILVALCVTLFLLMNSLNFCICLFLSSSKDFLHKFPWIFSIRWNSSGVADSNILPFNCSMLFLRLPHHVIDMHLLFSCNNSLPPCWKIILLPSILIWLFSCRSFGRILLWWQQKENCKWLV